MNSARQFSIATALLLRGIGLVLILAFVSLWLQVDVLFSADGLLPVEKLLQRAERRGLESYWLIPSLFWLSSSDLTLHLLLATGTLAGICVLLGYHARLALGVAWVCWLSFLSVGQLFLSYQWDVLLLEACFLAFLAYPAKRHLSFAKSPPLDFLSLLLFRLLLFRLLFSSGFVKLASADPHWNSLEALRYHFLTQPLPTPLAPFVHHLPTAVLDTACFFVFVVELLLPFFIFGPRLLRLIAGSAFILFQILIALTGNYTFFNLLTIILVLPLFDDAFLGRILRIRTLLPHSEEPTRWKSLLRQPLKLSLAFAGALQLWLLIFGYTHTPGALQELMNAVRPFRSLNSYGLFAVMTEKRYELQFEGSLDGSNWQEYQFRWKPGDINVAPNFLAPHQARVDWQLWFAALSPLEQNTWVLRLVEELLKGNPLVRSLFASAPFQGETPRYVRILHYEYTFSSNFERSSEGRWWRRRLVGIYMPALSKETK